MAYDLSDVPGCPFSTLEELRAAVSEERAFLSVDQSFSIAWIDLPGANPSRVETVFHFALSWAMVWVGVAMVAFAWPSIGWKALWLIPVSLLAGLYCRPWRGLFTLLIALAALAFADGLLSWIGGTWLLTGFLVSGWVVWCADRLRERLLLNESLLALALQPRGSNPITQGPIAAIREASN